MVEALSPLQEDALVGLMFEEFGKNRYTFLDYDKVKRHAFQLQNSL